MKHLIKRSASGVLVLHGFFDPYMENLVAPDLLLTGIGKLVVFFILSRAEIIGEAYNTTESSL